MTLHEVVKVLDAKVHCNEQDLDREVFSACGADLMSDVLAFSKEKVALLTGLINPQVIRTAEMMDIRVVIFVRGKSPTPEIIEFAEEREMVVLSTDFPMFTACGLLYQNGLTGGRKI